MRLALAWKNFAAHRAVSHTGVGIKALNTANTFRDKGLPAEVWPIADATDLANRLQSGGATHVVISAPWISTANLARLCAEHAPGSGSSRRGAVYVEFPRGGNCARLSRWVQSAYAGPCLRLPDLYHLESSAPRRERFPGGTLRVPPARR